MKAPEFAGGTIVPPITPAHTAPSVQQQQEQLMRMMDGQFYPEDLDAMAMMEGVESIFNPGPWASLGIVVFHP